MTRSFACKCQYELAAIALALICGALVTSLVVSPAYADDGPAEAGASQQWALLIGCEKYHRANKLRHTVNDVQQLAKVLHSWGGYGKDHIIEMTDDSANDRYKPLKTNLQAELPKYLKRIGPHDVLVVYFSGHGFRDTDGRMYLAPLDVDPDQPADTGIPVEWFRQQIAACPAGFKLLMIDACHAGSEKGDDESSGIGSNDLGAPFKDLEQVVTLASSTADQKSQIWEDKEQSLFSYWLQQGLKGHADIDGDGNIDIDEIYKYVSRMVTQTAELRFSHPQTPVRIVRSGVHDVPVIVHLQPQRLKSVLSEMAEQMADAIVDQRQGKVGVLEFTNDTKLGELLGADFGPLGKWCAAELERQLTDRCAGKYSVIDNRRLQAALSSQRFRINDLGSANALKGLSKNTGGMPVVAVGTLRGRAGDIIGLQCKLLKTDDGEAMASAGGMARITESEWAMFGHSAIVPSDDGPSSPTTRPMVHLTSTQTIRRLDDAALGDHPLKGSNSPFGVRILVGGKPRQGAFRGNDLLVPLRAGEVYQIEVENRSGREATMRLLVDGLNTLPEKDSANKGIVRFVVAPRVNLDEARHWVLKPKGRNLVAGFVTETGAQGKLREFKVVDADKSLAARQQFTDQIGLITAAFYEVTGRSRGIGTDLGAERTADLSEQGGVGVGPMICTINIRYVAPEAMASGR